MFTLEDVHTIEGDEENEEQYFCSLQRAINSLVAWKFQGSYGREMMAAIEAGKCMLGRDPTADYWGNRIPSRTEVKEGTKGSLAFVVERCGKEWAEQMEVVD